MVLADLADPGSGDRLLAAVADLGITVDTVINNAGSGLTKEFADCDASEIGLQLRLNIDAVVDISRAFLPQLLTSGRGALVNVASLTSRFRAIGEPGCFDHGERCSELQR